MTGTFYIEGDFFTIEGACYGVNVNTSTDDDLGTSPVVDFGMALKRAQHLLSQRIDGVLRPLDLNLGLWVVLREVSKQPGASASELARASFHTPQTLSGLLRRLQERGLVERSTGRAPHRGKPPDRRRSPRTDRGNGARRGGHGQRTGGLRSGRPCELRAVDGRLCRGARARLVARHAALAR
ncbi:MarR family transcriptional regulator [Streptomyces sp. T1317-0309]|nr:MarR family transcriptional regulator [Streptomyces sp. T1317-0309]